MQQDGAAAVTNHLDLGLGDRVLVMGANPTMCECLTAPDAVTFEVIVVEAEVVCMVRFNSYTVGCSHAFVGLFGLQSGSAGGAGDEVIIQIIRVVVGIEDGAPEFFVGEESG